MLRTYKSGNSYGPNCIFTFIYMPIIIRIHSLTKSQNLTNPQIFMFLSHLLSHVFPSKHFSSHTNTHTHLFFTESLTNIPSHEDILLYLYFLAHNHVYSVTHTDILKVSHSYSSYHSLTHTHSVWMNPGPRILQYINC